ncbi:MAG: hypothetical protein D3924_02380 [Candidatus Electrothrix sp. AR4]|nr:hypothetical protein [Candidatus Electrothrix sp. AR4]
MGKNILDRVWQRRNLKFKLGAHIVRYADDFVVMCRSDVEKPMEVVHDVLKYEEHRKAVCGKTARTV